MKKTILLGSILFIGVSLFACSAEVGEVQTTKGEQKKQINIGHSNVQTVESLVKEFGGKLKMVSLLAPKDVLELSMKENYGSLVSEQLLEKWIADPNNAPGRMVSSPWPDRIEILGTSKLSEDSYEVKGKIIEITSKEEVSGGFAAKRPITLVVKKMNDKWLIDDVILGAYEDTDR